MVLWGLATVDDREVVYYLHLRCCRMLGCLWRLGIYNIVYGKERDSNVGALRLACMKRDHRVPFGASVLAGAVLSPLLLTTVTMVWSRSRAQVARHALHEQTLRTVVSVPFPRDVKACVLTFV